MPVPFDCCRLAGTPVCLPPGTPACLPRMRTGIQEKPHPAVQLQKGPGLTLHGSAMGSSTHLPPDQRTPQSVLLRFAQ